MPTPSSTPPRPSTSSNGSTEDARRQLEAELDHIEANFRRFIRTLNVPYQSGRTPKELVWSLNKSKLYRYVPVVPPEKRHKEPLLLVYALMNRPYILDLRPGGSFIEYMVSHGHDVYLLDWGAPGPEDKDLQFDDYIFDYLTRAVRKMKQVSRSEQFNMLGWCIGAILASSYAALRPDDGLKNLILLTPPLDFEDKTVGNFMGWISDSYFDVEKLLARFGNMPGELLSYGAKALKPVDAYIQTYLRLWENITNPKLVESWQAMNTWINDNVDMAGGAFKQLVKDLYIENKLAEGKWTLRGETVDLGNIKASVMMVLARADHIVMACQSETAMPLLTGTDDKELFRLPGGHVGLMVGSSAYKSTWPHINEWLSARTTRGSSAQK